MNVVSDNKKPFMFKMLSNMLTENATDKTKSKSGKIKHCMLIWQIQLGRTPVWNNVVVVDCCL